jgi:glucose/arabinose dehydrogenase
MAGRSSPTGATITACPFPVRTHVPTSPDRSSIGVPIIAPGNLMFYRGTQTFPQWNGNGFVSGMQTRTLNRIVFDGHGGAKAAERWDVGHRIRDVEQGPDGSLWMLEDADPGALIHVTPKSSLHSE